MHPIFVFYSLTLQTSVMNNLCCQYCSMRVSTVDKIMHYQELFKDLHLVFVFLLFTVISKYSLIQNYAFPISRKLWNKIIFHLWSIQKIYNLHRIMIIITLQDFVIPIQLISFNTIACNQLICDIFILSKLKTCLNCSLKCR